MVAMNKANEPESCLEQQTNRTYQFLLEPPQTRVHAPRFRLGELLLHIVLFIYCPPLSLPVCFPKQQQSQAGGFGRERLPEVSPGREGCGQRSHGERAQFG